MTKRRPSWSERWQWVATLVCGLLLLNLPDMAWAVAKKPGAVNAVKKGKTLAGKAAPHLSAGKHARKPARKKGGRKTTWSAAASGPDVGLAELQAADEQGLRGSASFYSQRFNGRRSASGERFDGRAFTAASNHFPLGSRVAVRRLDNARCAIVKVSDRMHARNQRRIIDVSRAVAEYLDMVRAGVVMVRVVAVRPGDRQDEACQAAFEPDDDCPDCNRPPRWSTQEPAAPGFR